ncbi:MAG: hypothetical protein ABI921_07140, partial [Panacibacter sp.]
MKKLLVFSDATFLSVAGFSQTIGTSINKSPLKNNHMPFIQFRKVLLCLCLFNSVNTYAQNNLPQLSNDLVKNFTTKDTLFKEPYVDVDEWRDIPVRHRYVHGGFKGNDTRFSFYFPPKEKYQGRFYQYVTPFPDNENLSQGASGSE